MTPEQKQEVERILIQFEGLTFNHETRKAMCDRLRDLLIGTAEPEGDDMTDDYDEAGEPTQTYKVRLMVTARIHAEDTFEAQGDEAAQKYVEALNPRDFIYSYSSDDGVEGDEVAFWSLEDDETGGVGDEGEVVLMKEGEPFSWDAVNITKDLAKLQTVEFNHEDVAKLIQRAITACSRIQEQGR
jgi:uncharacterized protein YprB with RNaseH-like and TPR domain